ncbi:MAG TPA: hypothetical protein VGF45_17315 [Polyangia bacterium]
MRHVCRLSVLTVVLLAGSAPAWSLPKGISVGGIGGGEIGPIGPIGPVLAPEEPPAKPGLGGVTRTATSIALTVHDLATDEEGLELQRKGPGASVFAVVASWGAQAGTGGTQTATDAGLPADSPHRYRVRTWNQFGSRYSDELLVYTKGAGHAVWRAELVLETGTASNADTEDEVRVGLNPYSGSPTVPRGNLTFLDYARDDFERGHTDSYDLNLNGVSELADINTVYVAKGGDDAWCLRSLALKVNNQQVFSRSFASEPNGCRWIDDDDGHTLSVIVPFADLRASAEWQGYNHTAALFALAFFGIPNAELVSRFEAIVGDAIHDNELYWGQLYGAAVEVTRGCPANVVECNKLHVDLDLAASVTGPNPEVDIDFDVNVACTGGNLEIATENFHVEADSALIWELVSLGLIEFLDNAVEDEVRSSFEAIERSVSGVGACKAFVDDQAGLRVEKVEESTPPRRNPRGDVIIKGAKDLQLAK